MGLVLGGADPSSPPEQLLLPGQGDTWAKGLTLWTLELTAPGENTQPLTERSAQLPAGSSREARRDPGTAG